MKWLVKLKPFVPRSDSRSEGLHPGTEVEIVGESERIVIEPVTRRATVIEREGLLIVTSELAGEPADQQSVREDRLNRLSGNRS